MLKAAPRITTASRPPQPRSWRRPRGKRLSATLKMGDPLPFPGWLRLPVEAEVHSVFGRPELFENVLTLEGLSFVLPEALPVALPPEVRLFYAVLPGAEFFPLLLVGEGLFWRFDHLLGGREKWGLHLASFWRGRWFWELGPGQGPLDHSQPTAKGI